MDKIWSKEVVDKQHNVYSKISLFACCVPYLGELLTISRWFLPAMREGISTNEPRG